MDQIRREPSEFTTRTFSDSQEVFRSKTGHERARTDRSSTFLFPRAPCLCWSEGTNPAVIEAFEQKYPQTMSPQYDYNEPERWVHTATNTHLERGDPLTLTWGFLPDTVEVQGFNGFFPSRLIRMMDGQYGAGPGGDDLTQRPWFWIFQAVFDRWSAVTGARYIYEPHDDQAPFPDSDGILGVRPDIRIAAVPLDGNEGYNIYAFNYAPSGGGDMVLDFDNGANFGSRDYNSRFIRNVVAHEHGHGLGLLHACPIEQTKLMEPTITTRFDGPQHDDILGANRSCGDRFEFPNGDDTPASAFDLGSLAPADTVRQDTLSIDGRTDEDYYAFTVPPTMRVTVTITPVGYRYYSSTEASGCSPFDYFDSRRQNNIGFQLLGQNGSKILASGDYMPLGLPESVENFLLSDGPGTYFIHVFGDTDKVQLYDLEATVSAGQAPVAICKNVKACQGVFDLNRFNAGSYDPDGDPVTFTVIPSGPFSPGATEVILIVSDGYNADTCQAMVTVNRPPVAMAHDITVAGDITQSCQSNVSPNAIDNGSSDPDGDTLVLTLAPPGPFPPGVNQVKLIATDPCHASDTADVQLTVNCPVGVRLLSFTAERNPEGALIRWAIADPVDHLGFHIDRETTGGTRARITNQLLSGETEYAYLDKEAPREAATYWLEEWSRTGVVTWHGPVDLEAVELPADGRVRVYPNPFAGSTMIQYFLADTRVVSLTIFDAGGHKVRELVKGTQDAGEHLSIWNGYGAAGSRAIPGIYFIRLVAGNQQSVHKLVVLN